MAAKNAKNAKSERAAVRRATRTPPPPPPPDEDDDEADVPAPKAKRRTAGDIVKGNVPADPKKKVETAKERKARLKKVKPVRVVATERGYYENRVWSPGDKFDMVIDPTLEPPKWVKLVVKGKKKQEEEELDEDVEIEDEDLDEDEETDEDTDEDDEEI